MQQPMAPIPPAMPPLGAYQNDEPTNEAGLPAGFTGNQPDSENGLSDAALAKALQSENQPMAFQNDVPPPGDQSNFFQAPQPTNEQQQQPLVDEPAGEPPAVSPMVAPQHSWDRSTLLQ